MLLFVKMDGEVYDELEKKLLMYHLGSDVDPTLVKPS